MRSLVAALFLLPFTFLLSGCAGYSLGPAKPSYMKDIHTIAVRNFKNQTLEPRLEVLLANTVIKQIQQDGTYRLVDEKDADAILEGELQELDRRPSRSVKGNVLLAREYRLILRAHYRLYRRDTGADLDARSITGDTNFFVSGSTPIQADVNADERQAIPLATEDLAIRLVANISEGW